MRLNMPVTDTGYSFADNECQGSSTERKGLIAFDSNSEVFGRQTHGCVL